MNTKAFIITASILLAIIASALFAWQGVPNGFQSPMPPQPPTPPPVAETPPPGPPTIDLGACADIISTSTIYSQNPNLIVIQGLYVQTSTSRWNAAMLSTAANGIGSGYCLLYPKDWGVRLAGAAGVNLWFNDGPDPNSLTSTATGRILFVQAANGASLEDADKATVCYECDTPALIVNPNETSIHREIQTIGSNRVLALTSESDGLLFTRYLLFNAGAVYMFQAAIPAALASGAEYSRFLLDVRAMVESTRFGS